LNSGTKYTWYFTIPSNPTTVTATEMNFATDATFSIQANPLILYDFKQIAATAATDILYMVKLNNFF